jgi:hypothetical protein
MCRWLAALRWSLVVFLGVFGVAKLLGGAPPETLVGKSGMANLVGACELIVAVGLWRNCMWAWLACVGVAVSGVLIALLLEVPCGCGGHLIDTARREHLTVSSALGVLASYGLLRRATPSAQCPND